MPKLFSTIKKPVSTQEKYERAIEYYMFDDTSFKAIYLPVDDGMTDEERKRHKEAFMKAIYDNNEEEIDRLASLHPYIKPKMNIEETLKIINPNIIKLIEEFVNKDIYDETIIMKCLKCNHEEELDYEIIEETWFDGAYPIGYCPNCDKPKFVPLDIWNMKNKHKK